MAALGAGAVDLLVGVRVEGEAGAVGVLALPALGAVLGVALSRGGSPTLGGVENVLLAAVTFVFAVALQQLAKGGLRWRELTVAGHELDVAEKLGDTELARELRSTAEARVTKYLQQPRMTRSELARSAVAAATLVFALGVAAVTAYQDAGSLRRPVIAVAAGLGAVFGGIAAGNLADRLRKGWLASKK